MSVELGAQMCSPGARKASSRPLGLNCEGFPYLSCAPMHKTSPIMRAGKYTSEVWQKTDDDNTQIFKLPNELLNLFI